MIIKLTKLNGKALYVNTDYIMCIEANYRGSYVTNSTTLEDHEVKESPEQIMELINEHK